MGWITATALFLQISVQMGTPILFGTLGGILGEKTGNLNLGVEGMMIMGAAVGFKVALVTANPWLAVLAAGIAGALGALIYFFIKKTRIGLNMRAVGENPAAADASGINVNRYKYLSLLAGGFLCGVGGAYLSLVFVPSWQDNITNGLGWIAVALVIFSTWNPAKAIFGAYLFGALRGLGYKLQNVAISLFGLQFTIPSQLLDMVPYAATILVLVIITMRKKRENQPPASLSTSYFREER